MPETESAASKFLRRIDLWHVILILPWFALAIRSGVPMRDNSYLWHVTAGRLQIDTGAVITADPFSFTRLGEAWRTQSWLADLGYAWLDERFGFDYLPVMVGIVSSVALVGVLVLARHLSRSLQVTAVIAVLTVDLMIAFLNPRPVIFSFALFALFILAERDARLRWTLPAIFWIWASVHGSFVIGGAYLVLSAVRSRRRSGIVDVAACSTVALATAHGWGVIDMLVGFAGAGSGLETISEWRTPDLLTAPIFPLFVAIVFLIWAGIEGRLRTRDLVVLVPFLLLAFSANRAVPPAWLGIVPILALAARDLRTPERSVSPVRGGLHLAIVAVLIILPLVFVREPALAEARFPVDAVGHLETEHVFHDDAAGGYIIYAQWPDRLVYVDDRAELYGDMLVTFAEVRGASPAWEKVFEEYGITEALLKRGTPLGELLTARGWAETYGDEEFVILRET